MPTFAYIARGRDGKPQKGTMAAESRQALMQILQSRGLTPDQSSIKEQAAGQARSAGSKRVKQAELIIFTRQLATMVDAGLPLLQCLDILAEQTDDANFSKTIQLVAQDVEGGETFSEALRKFPRAFPDLYVAMVRAGEAGGDLSGVLLRLADLLEANAELRRRIRSAMTYPVGAFSLIMFMAIGLIMFVVPQFKAIFDSLGGDLPVPTQILIFMSDILLSWRLGVLIVGVVAAVIAVRMYGKTPSGRYNLDALMLRMPVFGGLQGKVSVARFTGTLASLTRSGVAILQALEIVERTAGNEVYAKVIRDAADSVRNGETLADPLARTGVFPTMVTRMISVGEKTGALEQMLDKIAESYQNEVRATVDSLTSLIEPFLIMMMGVIVGGIVVALMLPILSISSLVN